MNCLFLSGDFKLAQKYLFHALEVLPVARNAKFQPMYPLLEGIAVRWFGHSNKVLMNGRSKCLSGLVFPPSKECFQFWKQKEITWARSGEYVGVRQNSYFFFLQKRRNYCGGMSWVGYKSQVRSDPPIIFLPIINFIFVIISKLWFKCPVYQFYMIILYNCNVQQWYY